MTTIPIPETWPPPKHKIVYLTLSQLLDGILRVFKVLIRTLGQGAHIGSNSDVIWSTFIFYCIHNGCYFDHICRIGMICHYFNVIWKIKLLIKRNYKYARSSIIHCSIKRTHHQYYVNLEYIRIWKYRYRLCNVIYLTLFQLVGGILK